MCLGKKISVPLKFSNKNIKNLLSVNQDSEIVQL